MFSLTLRLFSVVSLFLCTHVYSSLPLYLLGLNFNLLISAHFSSLHFVYSHLPELCTCFYLSILQVRLGSVQSVLKLRGLAWAGQETSLLNPPPLALLLGIWLFFTSLCTRQMYRQLCTPLDVPLLSSPKEIAFLVSLSFNLKIDKGDKEFKNLLHAFSGEMNPTIFLCDLS